jgi:hypothetical protein
MEASMHYTKLLAASAMAALLGAGLVAAQDDPLNGDPDAIENGNGSTPGEEKVIGDISSAFADFAGSEDNADALTRALRTGSEVTLSDNGATTSFTPATGHLGYGEVYISLSLAEAMLKDAGITDPTPEQIAAVLNGGEVTAADGSVITYEGILVQRAEGRGWGEIANAAGLNLGLVIASKRSGKDLTKGMAIAKPAERGNDTSRAARERADTPGNAGVTGRPEGAGFRRPDRADNMMARMERFDRPVRVERPVRIERPMRPERPVKF